MLYNKYCCGAIYKIVCKRSKFNPPKALNFSRPGQWPKWKTRLQRFRIATKLDKEDENVQVASLIYSMGPEAENLFKSFNLSEDDADKYDTVMEKFQSHFIPKRNVNYERAVFPKRQECSGESVKLFVR